MVEIRDIPGFPGYRIARDGRVWSRTGRELNPYRNRSGYLGVKADGKFLALHRAIALAWLGDPGDMTDVNHIDGDKDNNDPSNLEWCTRSQNIRHALAHGLHACPETPVVGFNPKTGAGIWAKSQAEVRAFGFLQPLVNKCLKGERRHHRGFVWRYAA